MTRLSKAGLLSSFCANVLKDGRTSIVSQPEFGSAARLPWRFVLRADGHEDRRLQIFCWNLTHGGYSRSASEFRVQITTSLKSNAEFSRYRVLLLGYLSLGTSGSPVDPLKGIEVPWTAYVAWNPAFHRSARESASCQVGADLILEGWRHGVASGLRTLSTGLQERVFVVEASRINEILFDTHFF